jgi:hypothetical protein
MFPRARRNAVGDKRRPRAAIQIRRYKPTVPDRPQRDKPTAGVNYLELLPSSGDRRAVGDKWRERAAGLIR